MKRNLLKGIVLIGAVVLSSCSSTNKLAAVKNTIDDDVYYTKAKAGDKTEYFNDNTAQQNGYTGDDDYYYYGDYTSRLNRFSSFSPFDYDDDFYFSYVPYNNGFGQGLSYSGGSYGLGYAANLGNSFTSGYVYSPYDYGYSPYYNLGGYDDFGYGDIYSSYLLGGGSSWHHHNKNSATLTGISSPTRGTRVSAAPGASRAAYYPGRPTVGANSVNTGVSRNGVSLNGNNNARQTRESFRPTQQSYTPQQQSNNTSSSSNNTSSAPASGGGGRPVRP
jgi:hypothetical protein